MKKAFFSAFAALMLLLVTACTSKTEKTSETISEQNYEEFEVGYKKEGSFKISNLDLVKKEWENRLQSDGRAISLKNFRIVEGTTAGDSAQLYYILVANSADGKIKTASLLNLKDTVFYFETYRDQDNSTFYSNIICEGDCTEGCDPIVTISNGKRYLNCSQCPNCLKNEGEIR